MGICVFPYLLCKAEIASSYLSEFNIKPLMQASACLDKYFSNN